MTAGGEVIGVITAADGAGFSVALHRDRARELVDELRDGDDVDGLGINGRAVRSPERGLASW